MKRKTPVRRILRTVILALPLALGLGSVGAPALAQDGARRIEISGDEQTTNPCDDFNPCTFDVFTELGCLNPPRAIGFPCDDGEFCNGDDACSAGECVLHDGDPCPGADQDGNCSESCDEATDTCTGPDPEESACDDGLFCNGEDHCHAGICDGHSGDPCELSANPFDANCSESCNEQSDTCDAPDPDETPCDDGLFCNGDDICKSGACSEHTGDPCETGTLQCGGFCSEASLKCDGTLPDSSPCDDGIYCNGDDWCVNGFCDGHAGDPCPGPDGDGDCSESCDETSASCEGNDLFDSFCDDGLFCNGSDRCNDGACEIHVDAPCPGPDFDDNCAESCDEDNDSCDATDFEGAACDDGVFCNGGDSCVAGQCASHDGSPCEGPDGDQDCRESCDELAQNCAGPDPDFSTCEDDGLFCTTDSFCRDGSCTHTGDPCAGLGECVVCDEEESDCVDTDIDEDSICALHDNCPIVFNPDQADSDCPFPDLLTSEDCEGKLPDSLQGCCDGGDVCDACAATPDNESCDPELSGGAAVDSAGGSFVFADCLGVEVPPGALSGPTSLSITAMAQDSGTAITHFILKPDDPGYARPISFKTCWPDTNDDKSIDLGVCADGVTPCDSDASCFEQNALSPCTGLGQALEEELVLRRNGHSFDWRGEVIGTVDTCGDEGHQESSGCTTAASSLTCQAGSARGVAGTALGGCCDTDENTWSFHACMGGEYYMGDLAGSLVPGKGSFFSDCFLEWSIVNPFNPKLLDTKGLLSAKQSCTDGDPTCDLDGIVNGECVWSLGMCFNVHDNRLVKPPSTTSLCTPTDIANWEIRRPVPTSEDPTEALNAQRLRDSVVALAPETAVVTGRYDGNVEFTVSLAAPNACTAPIEFKLPLRGAEQNKKSKATLSIGVTTATDGNGVPRAKRDKDKLKLTCFPAQ